MLSPITIIIIYVILNTAISISAIVYIDNMLKGITKKLNDYSSNIGNYAANENDVIEDLSEKVSKLESHVANLERKMKKGENK